VITSNIPVAGFETTNPPRLAIELDTFFRGEGFRLFVNPPDGAVLDLSPGEGASVISLAMHHPERRVRYVAPSDPIDAGRLERNLSRLAITRDRIIRAASADGGSGVVVLRQRMTAGNWKESLDAVSRFRDCRLLFVECDGQPETYIGELLSGLSAQRFVLDVERLTSASFQQPGLGPSHVVLWLALTRSGLDLPANGSLDR
jgi:hypothetical protein